MSRPAELAAEFFDRIAPVYDDTYSEPRFRAEDDFMAAAVADALEPHRRLLDVGCGTGWVPDHCTVHGYVGLDVSQGMIDQLRTKHRHVATLRWDMNRAPWPAVAGSFDVCTSMFTAANYTDEATFMGEARRALAPGGRLFVVVHGPASVGRVGQNGTYGATEMYTPEIGWRPWHPAAVLTQPGWADLTVRGFATSTLNGTASVADHAAQLSFTPRQDTTYLVVTARRDD